MKIIAIVVIALVLMIPMSSAFASWHWSSPYKVCGMEVIKKTQECHLDSESTTPVSAPMEPPKMMCSDGLTEIIKKTTNTMKCVKDSSYEKLILRGWGISV
ncbi:MAG: hypothetical protein ACE5Q9_02155 [Nitrosopumilus sp.]